MILPKNGNVVIVDDMYEEALPLIQVLSQNSVPVHYFDGKKHMPAEPLVNIRLLLLDMRYAEGTTTSKAIISTLMSIIQSIIHKDNGPYIILVWSKHDGEDLEDFKEAVNKDDGFIVKPLAILNLEKKECFETIYSTEDKEVTNVLAGIREMASTNENISKKLDSNILDRIEGHAREGYKRLKNDGLKIIQEKIASELSTLGCFNLFFLWENIVGESSGRVINNITRNFEVNGTWNDNINTMLYNMAEANAGKPNLIDDKGQLVNELVVKNVLYTFNDILPDEIGNMLNNSTDTMGSITIKPEQYLSHIEDGGDNYWLKKNDNGKYEYYKNDELKTAFDSIYHFLTKNYEEKAQGVKLANLHIDRIASVNSKLLLQTVPSNLTQPGNLYIYSGEVEQVKSIIEEVVEAAKLTQQNVQLDELCKQCKYLEVEVSPSCDFAQSKWKVHRILPGAAIPFEKGTLLKKQGEFFYTSPVVRIQDENYYLLFNFKLFTSKTFDHLTAFEPIFILRSGLQVEIKNKLSQHFLRAGIVNLNC